MNLKVPTLKVALLVAVLVGMVAVVSARASGTVYEPQLPHPQAPSTAPNAVTMSQAWDLLDAYAKAWRADALLLQMGSSDIDGDADTSGADGKRRAWVATFASQASSSSVRLQLADGAVVGATEQKIVPDVARISERPSVDSPEALRLVIAGKPAFSPVRERAKGYHFVFQRDKNPNPTVIVSGSHDSMSAVGIVDAKTHKVLSYQLYTTGLNGAILYSTDAGETWQASDLTGHLVSSITPNPLVQRSAFASVANRGLIEVFETQNGGKNWSAIGKLPAEGGYWAYSTASIPNPGESASAVILVGTPSGLWISTNNASSWERIGELPAGPPQWTAALGTSQILVSITAGPNTGLYLSKDLHSWTRVADGVYRLSRSNDRESVLAIEAHEESGDAILFDGRGSSKIKTPPRTLRAAGDFIRGSHLLAQTPGTLSKGLQSQSGQGERQWTRVSSGTFASISVPPDYSSSKVVLQGGFRTGVFRSADEGESWKQVLSPKDLHALGTGEISDIEYLTDRNVVLVNGGDFTWTEF
ncbi:MAG: glycoside hydrolase [Chloroflexi bacterium]|nr:glycoside hydrolase [Chloroflexota bacterium]